MGEIASLAEPGVFCEVFGISIRNRILEEILTSESLDWAVGDIAKDLEISRPKAYQIIEEFKKKGYIKKSRMIGKTQLYLINKENKHIKVLLKAFKECLNMVMDECIKKEKKTVLVK